MSGGIKYVVLSDVHLGAENSILTQLEAGTTTADTHVPSPALLALADCLAVLAGGGDGDRPTLIAAGDLIDLALATSERAFPVFGQFVKALADREDPPFADEMIFLPGNHDHTIWAFTRERWLEDQVAATHQLTALHGGRRTGPMLLEREPDVESTLLTALMRRWSGRPQARMRVLYPDLALCSEDGSRSVLVTHGHYIDSVSMVMSGLLRLFAPQVPKPSDVETMERENWPWVDFFFSSMTRSGKPGALVESIYDALQDPKALEGLVDLVARNISADAGGIKGDTERWVIRSVVGRVLEKFACERDRANLTELLGDGSKAALQTYVSALRERLVADTGSLPGQASLIIGHTHKPFSQWWPDETWPAGGLAVVNTGGWVVDHFAPQPLQGGAVALVSEDLDVVLLRMYQQVDDPSAWRIAVEAVAEQPGAAGFAERVRGLIDAAAPPWSTFSEAAAALVAERRREMELILQGKLKVLRD